MTIDNEYEIYPGKQDGPGEIEALYWEMVNHLDDELGSLGAHNDGYIRLVEFAENAMMLGHSPSKFPGPESWNAWKNDALAFLNYTHEKWEARKLEIQREAALA